MRRFNGLHIGASAALFVGLLACGSTAGAGAGASVAKDAATSDATVADTEADEAAGSDVAGDDVDQEVAAAAADAAADGAQDVHKPVTTIGEQVIPPLDPPTFTKVVDSTGAKMTPDALQGHWTVLWFYPAASTAG